MSATDNLETITQEDIRMRIDPGRARTLLENLQHVAEKVNAAKGNRPVSCSILGSRTILRCENIVLPFH